MYVESLSMEPGKASKKHLGNQVFELGLLWIQSNALILKVLSLIREISEFDFLDPGR